MSGRAKYPLNRDFVAAQLARVANALPERLVSDGAHGRYHIELSISVAEGTATHVKTSAFFERFDNLEGRD